jgi:hypothetical protein
VAGWQGVPLGDTPQYALPRARFTEGAVRLSRPRQSSYCLAPHHLPGIRRFRLACPPQIVAVNRVVLQKYGFDYERAIGRRVLTLYAAITHQGRRLACRQPTMFVATIGVVAPACEMSVRMSVH